MLKLLQVCNVGRIVGGTAACAWSVTRALPWFEHAVAFLSDVSDDTRDAFSRCRVMRWSRVTPRHIADIDPDIVLLHNTPRSRWSGPLPGVSVQYLHSKIDPAPADLTLYCSAWLAERYGGDPRRVCLQGVPRPRRLSGTGETRALREHPVIGRICTPQRRKWPANTVEFYAELSRRFPRVRWEFVGCPDAIAPALRKACGGNVDLIPASWHARSRLWQWDALLYHNPELTESFGRTVAEAMRAGCIPIVDDRGGFVEQVADGCGSLCRDVADFAAAIERLRCAEVRLQMSSACRAHADERFSLARFGADLLGWLRSHA